MNDGGHGGLGSFPVKVIPPSHDALYDSRRRASDPRPDPDAASPDEAPFVHLHVHSHFSFLDGAARVAELAARAAELGQPALALTDHDGLYGIVRFAKACERAGVQPIFGAEVRVEPLLPGAWLPGRDPDPSLPAGRGAAAAGLPASPVAPPASGAGQVTRGGTAATDLARSPAYATRDSPYHLVLLAETREGYANLCRLVSAAHLAVPERDHPPLVTREMLAEYREGLICLTGCRQGEVGRLVDGGHDAAARQVLLELRALFGADHLAVELQHFGYQPHREAEAGQDGALVVEKVRGDDGRLRHRAAPEQPAAPRDPGRGTGTPRDPGAGRRPRPQAFGVTAKGPRRDLPEGHPQRLNPADYDAGFHRDGRPWALSCLAYGDRLLRLARETGLPAAVTTDAHYARPQDRDLHLVVRAAGRDEPLSGYPEPVPGARCLRPRAALEAELAPLLALHVAPLQAGLAVGSAPPAPDGGASPDGGAPGAGAPTLPPSNPADPYPDPGPAASASGPGDPPLLAVSPLDTPALIAERCRVDLELGTYHFPEVPIPADETAYSLLAKRCFRGVERFYRPVPPAAVALLEHELEMIERLGFAHYFLVVHDIVRWARAQGIACSGRGSAGNSLVCHVLDITASEPLRHHLLFERFLNPNRREMPDIDVDFCSSRRDEVIEHIYDTFGEQNVAVVANVNTMSPRSAVRIVAEALGFAPTEINALAKHVPRHGDAGLMREYLAGAWPELAESPLQDQARYGPLLDLVERLDSFPMHLGTHLGGFVIADRPITYYAPLQWAAKGVVVIQFNKDDVAALGLVKMDILGLRTHSAVSETVHLVRRRTGRRLDPYALAPSDPDAYEIISNGGSIGLFQLESAGQRNLATRLQEETFDDIIAAIALYRPGPLEAEMIGPFIDRRWGYEEVSLPHPAMAEALGDTYGVILYQEQVLRVAQLVAGFSPAEADSLRRAMTREKSREEMAKIGQTFVHHAVARGVPEDAAREVFRQLEGFAAYGFNKSHSVCFAVISYATAYLKAHYPAEFLAAVMNNQPMGFYTPRTVVNDARRFGLAVRPLDINLSGRGFTVEDAEPPDPWAVTAAGIPAYDPFAPAWTAAHGWGLTPDDLAALQTIHGDAAQTGARGYGAQLQLTAPAEATAADPPPGSVQLRPGEVEPHHPGDDQADRDHPRPGAGVAHEEDAHGGRPGRADARPDGVGGADGDGAQRQVEQSEAHQGADGEGHGGPEPAEAVRLLEGDGEAHFGQAGEDQEHPGHANLRDGDGRTLALYHDGAPAHTPAPASGAGHPSPPAAAPDALPPPGAVPGDLVLPRAHRARARAGVAPEACLLPEGALAPGAGQALRVGLRYLKQMSSRALKVIEAERRQAPFSSFEDFYLRTRVEYPVAENLIRTGAFDSLEPDRTELLWRLPVLHDRLEALAGAAGHRGQLKAFFAPAQAAGLARRWSVEDKVRAELELLGLTVTCHPLQLYEDELRRLGVRMSYELPALGDEVPVAVAGVYERAQNPWMRSGKRTMFLTLEDAYGLFECVLFESKLARCAPVVARATYFLVRGRLQNNRKRGLAIVVDQLHDLEEVLKKVEHRGDGTPHKRPARLGQIQEPPTFAEHKLRVAERKAANRGESDGEAGGSSESGGADGARGPHREQDVYGVGTADPRKRPPGAGTSAIPKKVG